MTSVQKRERSMPLRELTAATTSPIATVSTNLLPPEVMAKRRLGWLKRRLGFALAALVLVLALAYLVVMQGTTSSQEDLVATQDQTSQLQRKANAFAGVVRIQGETAQIRSQLAVVMNTDVQWSALLGSFAGVAPRGLAITDLAATLGGAEAEAAVADPGVIGSLELSGSAKDYRSVATFTDALARLKGVAAVNPGRLGFENGRVTYTLNIDLAKTAFSGRYTPKGGR